MRRIRLSWIIFVALLLLIECKMGPKRKKKQEDSLLSRDSSHEGPVKVDVIAKSFGENLHLRCVANITNSVRFWWNFKNVTLQDNERVLIQTNNQSSDLKIRKARKSDSGIYECVVRLNGTQWVPSVPVHLKPPLKIKIKPKDVQLTTETGTFEWHCYNTEGSLVNATYSWFRKLLPEARWKKIDNNKERFRWKIPSRLRAEKDGYDVYYMYCNITYEGVTVRGSSARIVVTKPDAVDTLESCPAEMSEGIQWKETLLGLGRAESCLEGDENSGVAERVCEAFPGRPPIWSAPNLKDCSSPAFASLEDKLDALEEGFKINLTVKQALDELKSLTNPKKQPRPGVKSSARLFGKDLLATVDILKRTKGFFQKKENKSFATETLSSYTETASNVLDLENHKTWLEIEENNPETPANLVTSLDNFGFDLEKDFAGDGDIIQNRVERNLAFQMRRIQRKKDFIFEQNNSRIFLPQAVFNQTTSEAVIVVSVIYNTLASILGDVNVTSGNLSSHVKLLSNSRIISSIVKPFGVLKLNRPVKIVLEYSGTSEDKYDQRRCVFWRPEEANSQWSDEGCRLVTNETTKDVTTCECDHLTLFAVMVESSEGDVDAEEQAKLELISTVGSAISLAAIILTMIIYVYCWRALWSPRFVNFMNLCAAIALMDIFSVLRGPFQYDEGPCTAIGILLHFFVLALFMWMLCEGVLLCLLLTNIFKKNYGRRWYFLVHLIGWGLPALVVVISISARGVSFYGLAGRCWLSGSKGFIWAAIAPMILVLLASYAVYCVMLRRVITSHKVQQKDTLGKVKATARASIIIMPVLGFAWTFAILDFFFDEVAFKYLFAIFNSLQGLFIFIFHCVMNQQVQQAMFKNSKPAERKGILDRVKNQKLQMTGSQDSLETIK